LYLAAAQAPIYHMTYFQAVIIGLVQGFFELFPLSSLGHTVLIPSWIGGNWATLVRQESEAESPYLAFIVGLHLANAVALLLFYLREWARIISSFFRTLARRRIETDTERLAWYIVIATVPVGIIGFLLEHEFRVLFAKPVAAAVFLMCNGLILAAGEWYRRRHQGAVDAPAAAPRVAAAGALAAPASTASAGSGLPGSGTAGSGLPGSGLPGSGPAGSGPVGSGRKGAIARFRDERMVGIDEDAVHQLAGIGFVNSVWIGASQALALLAGISREGVVMVGGLFRGLNNENAMRFAFLLSTPVIFAAGALKVPDLTGSLGNGIRGQVVVGSLAAVVASLFAIAFLSRYFKTRTLVPFAVYSLLFGFASLLRFGLF
jgi:undecaprenyl-diphosphatase